MIDVWHSLQRMFHGVDDFENFLLILVTILFSLLFVRVIVAMIMGRWNLFPPM
ncbi:hypothetical protein [Megasphaera sueciensis]|jgi:hypothetical protein|uniref:hypothetical protein n=1 Tax=Megasphaera sueciensis TaxID=349094 RepID=UPI003D002613